MRTQLRLWRYVPACSGDAMLNLDMIQTGDILAFKPKGFLGKAINFFTPGKYSHIGVVYDKDTEFEMGGDPKNANALFRDMFELIPDAKDIDILRVFITGKGICPFNRREIKEEFKRICSLREGQPYDYKRIGVFAVSGFLMKIPGLSWIIKQWRRTDMNPMDKQDVCSALGRETVEIPIKKFIDKKFTLFPDIGINRSRPADFGTESPHLVLIN